MKKIHLSINIDAPREKVWNTITGITTYPIWTTVFSKGSTIVGSWQTGSKILFIGPDEQTGQIGGMVSIIHECKPNEYLSIQHIGQLRDGKEDTESPEIKAWAPSFENYTLKTTPEGTELTIDMDSMEDYYNYFLETWPKALQKLKEISETQLSKTITIETMVNNKVENVWESWTNPKHITSWCHASEDWEAPFAENDIRTGGKFRTTMSAKDKSVSFDFEGIYDIVYPLHLIEYTMPDKRRVRIEFIQTDTGTHIIESFDIENENPEEMQRAGWLSILNNFKQYTENNL